MGTIHDSGYDKDCDLCLFDKHYCGTCEDVVGHNHWHEDD